MSSSLRRHRVAALIAALVALASLPGVAAADDQIVGIPSCHGSGGTTTVDAGSPVTIRWGWGTLTRGLVIQNIKATDQTVTVNGQEIPDVDDYWGPPIPVQDPIPHWRGWWSYDLGVLDAGESVSVTLDIDLTHRILDLITLDGHHPAFAGPGHFALFECEITAA